MSYKHIQTMPASLDGAASMEDLLQNNIDILNKFNNYCEHNPNYKITYYEQPEYVVL